MMTNPIVVVVNGLDEPDPALVELRMGLAGDPDWQATYEATGDADTPKETPDED